MAGRRRHLVPGAGWERGRQAFSMIEVIVSFLVASVVVVGLATLFSATITAGRAHAGLAEILRHWREGQRLLLDGVPAEAGAAITVPGLTMASRAVVTAGGPGEWPGLEYWVDAPFSASYTVTIASGTAVLIDQRDALGQLVRYRSDVGRRPFECLLGDPPCPNWPPLPSDPAPHARVVVSHFSAEVVGAGTPGAAASFTVTLFYDTTSAGDPMWPNPPEDNQMIATFHQTVALRNAR